MKKEISSFRLRIYVCKVCGIDIHVFGETLTPTVCCGADIDTSPKGDLLITTLKTTEPYPLS